MRCDVKVISMANSNETRSLPLPTGQEMIWNAPPLCQCGGTGTMPIIGWPGRAVVCSCPAGKHIAAASDFPRKVVR